MTFELSTPEAKFAVRTIKAASILAEEVRQELAGATLAKGDRSPVTVADFAVQALVAHELSKEFPKDGFMAEESSALLREAGGKEVLARVLHFLRRIAPDATEQSIFDWIDCGAKKVGRRFWTLDPVDGTKGFLRADQYAVAFALIEDGEVRAGVLGCPNLSDASRPSVGGEGTLAMAFKGQGSWYTALKTPGRFKPLKVSDRRDTTQAVLLHSSDAGHTDTDRNDRFMQTLGISHHSVIAMSSMAKYVVLASGTADLQLRIPTNPERFECIWDQAAGAILVHEAGGRVTDLKGKAFDYTKGRTLAANYGVLASNGHVHDAALKAFAGL